MPSTIRIGEMPESTLASEGESRPISGVDEITRTISPVEVNSFHSVDAAAWAQSQASQHDALYGVATTVRNSQLDKSASATTRQSLSQDMREVPREGMCREQSRR